VTGADHIHVLVRGIILSQGHILLARSNGASNTFLPGGHVELREGLKDALAREIAEELGLVVQVGRYLGVVEHTWGAGQAIQHEINHVFSAALPGVSAAQPILSLERHLEFFWVPIADVAGHALQPSPLIGLIQAPLADGPGSFHGSTMASLV